MDRLSFNYYYSVHCDRRVFPVRSVAFNICENIMVTELLYIQNNGLDFVNDILTKEDLAAASLWIFCCCVGVCC